MIEKEILEKLNINNINPNQYSPIVLAYVGDTVYEVFVRTKVVREHNVQVSKLQKMSIKYVKASAQAEIYKRIEKDLTEEERKIAKRGMNAKVNTVPKNADILEYKTATGFESLIGYLYLSGNINRVCEIISMAIE